MLEMDILGVSFSEEHHPPVVLLRHGDRVLPIGVGRAGAEAFAIGAANAGQILCSPAGGAEADYLARAIISAETRAAAEPSHREADLTAILAEWASLINPRFTREQLNAARDALDLGQGFAPGRWARRGAPAFGGEAGDAAFGRAT